MYNKKNLLVLHLNEFDLEYLYKGAKIYKCRNIKKLLELKKITTYTSDKVQNKNLDPWVQSVTINTGQESKKHKIFKINQKLSKNINQIWDILVKNKINCGIWGQMNAIYRPQENLKFFFPDPWNFKSLPHPENLNSYFELPKYYSQNYTDVNYFKFSFLLFKFVTNLIFSKNIFYFINNSNFFLKLLFSSGLKNYILFFLFDLISIRLFDTMVRKYKTNFSYIFLNSLAHFQHNDWDEIRAEKNYFNLTDKILEIFFDIYKKNNSSLLIFNGFTQRKIKKEFILRPYNPAKFLKQIGIEFIKLEQDMTHGGFIYFENLKKKNQAINILKNFNAFNFYLFEIVTFKQNRIFYRVNIKSTKIINKIHNSQSKFLYYNKKSVLKKKISTHENNKVFLQNIKFIKSTGVHSNKGTLFYGKIKDDLFKKKLIHNKKIFNVIKNFYNI